MKKELIRPPSFQNIHLNTALMDKQKLSEKEREEIKNLHFKKLELMYQMEITDPIHKAYLRGKAAEITEVEFSLQKAWRWEQDQTKHRFWLLPHCLCPKMDNEDRWGIKFTMTRTDCPIHGEKDV